MLPGKGPKENLPSRWTLYNRIRVMEVRLWEEAERQEERRGCRGTRRKEDKCQKPMNRARGDGQPAFVL